TARTSRHVRDVRLQRFMLKWESRPRARSAASWPMMTAAVDVGGGIHARREATRVGEATSSSYCRGGRGRWPPRPTRRHPPRGNPHAAIGERSPPRIFGG